MFDVGGLKDIVDFGEILVVGFVATANNDDNIVIREGVNSDAGGTGIGGEIIVVIFDAAKFADEFEAVRKTVEVLKTFDDARLMFFEIFIW